LNDSTKPQRAKLLHGIQGLRGFAVLMVISVHLYELERKYANGQQFLGDWIHFNVGGVDLFLVISGFVLTYLAMGRFNDRNYVRSFAYSRLTRVYPAYMFYTLLMVPIFLVAPTLFNASEGHQVNLLRSIFLIPDERLPLIPVSWTLHHELYFYVVFGFMLMLPQSQLPKAMLAWLAVTVALVGWGSFTPRPEQGAFQRVFVNPINLEFLLGMVVAVRVWHGTRKSAIICAWIGLVGVAGSYACYHVITGSWWVDPWWRVLIAGVPAALICYAVVVVELTGGWAFARPLGWIGDAAYSTYLTHLITMSLFGKAWHMLGIEGWFPHLLFLCASVAVGILVGKFCFDRVEAPLQRFARKFEPGKVRIFRPAESEQAVK
jgi:exopolysaccharide production protein ExoZ